MPINPTLIKIDPVHIPSYYFFIAILFCHLCLYQPSGLFPSGFLTKNSKRISTMYVTNIKYLIQLRFTTLVLSRHVYKCVLRTSSTNDPTQSLNTDRQSCKFGSFLTVSKDSNVCHSRFKYIWNKYILINMYADLQSQWWAWAQASPCGIRGG